MKKQTKKNKQKQKDKIIIPKKALAGIAPAIAISAVLISNRAPGPLVLFLAGIAAGILIGKGFWKK